MTYEQLSLFTNEELSSGITFGPIGLTGYAQSGKDSVAKILVEKYGYTRVAFADKLREFVYAANPMVEDGIYLQTAVDDLGWEIAKVNLPEIRRLLQNVGLCAREMFGETFWIDQALSGYDSTSRIVITDIRFTNEADSVRSYAGAQIWRVTRPDVHAVNQHVSETQVENYPVDYVLVNDGTLDDLETTIKDKMGTVDAVSA